MVDGFLLAGLFAELAFSRLEMDTGFFVDKGNHGNGLTDGNPDRGFGPEMEFVVDDLSSVEIFDGDRLRRTEEGAGRTADAGLRFLSEGSADLSVLTPLE